MSRYLKSVVAAVGAILTGLSVWYGGERWYDIAVLVVTVAAVYVVPNTTPVVPAVKAAEKPSNVTVVPDDGWRDIK